MEKQSYSRRFVHCNKTVHSRKPTFKGFFKDSQSFNKTANIGAPVKVAHMLNGERITKSFCLRRWREYWKSNVRLGGPHFGSNSPRGMPRGMSNFGIGWYISGVNLVWKSDFRSFSVEFTGLAISVYQNIDTAAIFEHQKSYGHWTLVSCKISRNLHRCWPREWKGRLISLHNQRLVIMTIWKKKEKQIEAV